MAAYGLVIHDPTGVLAERKQAFASAYYTEDMRRWRIAGALWNIWHFGEYNGISRLAARGDGVGLLVAQDARPRHAMGAFELLGSIRSEEVKVLVRELDHNLGPSL